MNSSSESVRGHSVARLGGRVLLLLVWVALISACAPQAPRPIAPSGTLDAPTGQLPATVQPQHYRLDLQIDPRQQHFSGAVEIDLTFSEASDLIWLHGDGLRVSQVELLTADGSTVAATYQQVEETGVAAVRLRRGYGPGKATLRMRYSAAFNLALEGLYKVVEDDTAYAFTQFEAISARLAFPGFDEPVFKVPFDISLTVPADQAAIANTPAVEEHMAEDGYKTVRFATTKPIPTYLLAFAVGPFDIVEWQSIPASPVRDHSVPLRGVAVRGKGDQLEYALANTASILEALETYFGIPYPYAKLDLIAVPDFGAGAMENVGAITYREVLLLLGDQPTPQQIRRYERVHAHELAHQWFGNLVTPVWWDDIWLNEAFATWMAAVALERRNPQGGYRTDALTSSAETMVTDSLISARQIRQPILSSHDIASAFDGITYRKGGGVLTMFEHYLGEEAFRQGVNQYLRQHAFGNATADDFIAAIAAQAPADQTSLVEQAFRSFLEQPGLPLLDTSYNCAAFGQQDPIFQVRMTTRRYLPLGSAGSPHQRWQVPACIRYGADGETQQDCRILTTPLSLSLFRGECPQWLLPNADGAGYYRWNLPPAEWRQLLAVAEQLSGAEQMKLADSFVAAFQSGNLELEEFIEGVSRLATLPNYPAAMLAMTQLSDMLWQWPRDARQRQGLRQRLSTVYAGELATVGLAPQNDYQMAQWQYALVEFQALIIEDQGLRQQLLAQAADYTGYQPAHNHSSSEAPNLGLMDIALQVAVQEWGLDFTRHLAAQLATNRDPAFRNRAISGLSAARDPGASELVLDLILNPELRNNEIAPLLRQQIKMPWTRSRGWDWLVEHFAAVRQRIPVRTQGRLAGVGSDFCSPAEREMLDNYFSPRIHELTGGPRTLANTLERIDLCIALRQAHENSLAEILTDLRND
ncbi:MAG: M1 family metallopeptidase [Wenzhouxiangellaceae bacterium]